MKSKNTNASRTRKKLPPELFYKSSFLKNFAIFKGNYLCWNLFLIKLQVFRPATLLIQVFSYKYCEILKTPILKIICVRLLLTRNTNNICFPFLENVFYPNQTFFCLDFSLISLRSFDVELFLFFFYIYDLLKSPIRFFISN